jgi:methanogenic corrinoid protein MtbC1
VAAVFGGVVLHRNGWRIVYLGADTPLTDLGRAVKEKRPDVVILAAVTAQRFQECLPELVTLTPAAPLRLAGVGATILDGDPITEAQRLTPTRWMKALGGPGRVERIR